MKYLLLMFSVLSTVGCTVTYMADPADELDSYSREICIIDNNQIKDELLTAYQKVLLEKGFSVKLIQSESLVDACSLTSNYTGKWSWDFKTYMAEAEINVYEEGTLIASAKYSSPPGGWSMTTKIYESTEAKVRGMLDQLFPKI
jgi:hypothetical protein